MTSYGPSAYIGIYWSYGEAEEFQGVNDSLWNPSRMKLGNLKWVSMLIKSEVGPQASVAI